MHVLLTIRFSGILFRQVELEKSKLTKFQILCVLGLPNGRRGYIITV